MRANIESGGGKAWRTGNLKVFQNSAFGAT